MAVQLPQEVNLNQVFKYVAIEMIRNDANRNDKPEVGLFRGLKVRTDGKENDPTNLTLVIMSGDKNKKNDVSVLNVEAFNVMTIITHYDTTREMMVFRSTKDDQEVALLILKNLVENFRKGNRMVVNDPELIDMESFTHVPEELLGVKPIGTTTPPSTYHNYHGTGSSYNDAEWQKKRAAEEAEKKRQEELRRTPYILKRTGELPSAEHLKTMRTLAAAVVAGEYKEGPKVPPEKVPEEPPKDEKVTPLVPRRNVAGFTGE